MRYKQKTNKYNQLSFTTPSYC